MRPRTWRLRRAHAAGLATIAVACGFAATAAFSDQRAPGNFAAASTRVADVTPTSYPGLLASYDFTWGNGVESQAADLTPTWRANKVTQYGLVVERYVLTDGTGTTANDQAGVNVIVGDADTFQVRGELLYGAFTNYPTRLNGSLDVAGASGHFKYDAGFVQTGINGAPAAADHLINTAGAGLQFGNMTGRLGWASKFTSAYVAGELSNVSDGNRHYFDEFGANQDLGLIPFDVVVGAFVNTSGYRFTYPYPQSGYYSYSAQERQALKAAVRYPLGRHFDLSAIGIAGTSRTRVISGFGYSEQSYQQFAPALVYSNAGMQVSASGKFAQYLGGTYVLNYVSNEAAIAVRLRL